MIKYLLHFLTIKKVILVISSFFFTWLFPSFEVFNKIGQAINLMVESVTERYLELIFLTIFILVLVVVINSCVKHYWKTKTKTKNSIQSILTLSDVNEDSQELCKNNAVYLTRFKKDGMPLYVAHLFYSLFSYYSDPINLFFLVVALGQVYMFNDYKNFTILSLLPLVPLTVFSIMATVQYLGEVMTQIKQQI